MAAQRFTWANRLAPKRTNLLPILLVTLLALDSDISQQKVFPAAAASAQASRDLRWQQNSNNNNNHNNNKPTSGDLQHEQANSPPVVINKHNEITVGVGSNVSLPCTARGSAPLTFVWFQDERNLTTSSKPGNSNNEFPSSTKLLEEKRYEIAEELGPQANVTTSKLYLFNLKTTDSSMFLCWVENPAGYTLANISLIVTESLPQQSLDINYTNNNEQLSSFNNDNGNLLAKWLGRGLETRLGLISIGLVLFLVGAILVLLLLFKYNNLHDRSSKSSHSSELKSHHLHDASSLGGKISYSSRFSPHNLAPNQSHLSDSSADEEEEDENDVDNEEATTTDDSSNCRKNPKLMAASDLDGFIEHMRSGIINMDYHSMSPVIQFNNTLKQQQQQQRPNGQLAPAMHHYASGSGASSVPYYGGLAHAGSMATTTSDLSPGSGSGNTINTNQPQFVNQNGPPITNCDLPLNDMAPATNTTTTSYTSDYQSGYSEEPAPSMMPPSMYYTDAAANLNQQHHLQQQQHHHHHHLQHLQHHNNQPPQMFHPYGPANNSLFNQTNQLMMAPSTLRPNSMASQQQRGSMILHNNGVGSIVGSVNNLHQKTARHIIANNNNNNSGSQQRIHQRVDVDFNEVL